jgi:diaminopimelate epimerase
MSPLKPYFRLSGGGNDFLALVEPAQDPSQEQIRAWCQRGLSLGADGVFVLSRHQGGARLRHFNADGSPAKLCINGTRCAVRLAEHLGWSEREILIETGAGPILGRSDDATNVSLALRRPGEPRLLELQVEDGVIEGWSISVGVPHYVIAWFAAMAEAPVSRLGPTLRSHPDLGEAGANIDWVRFTGRHRLEIRSFERGVEAETLACGTGVLAAAATGLTVGRSALPVGALTSGGFTLQVTAWESPDATDLWALSGDARLLAEGEIHAGATHLPSPPSWS